jgi:hypothetical protein
MALIDVMRADLLAGRRITATSYADPAGFHGALVSLMDALPVIETWQTTWESRARGMRLRQRVYRLPAGLTALDQVVEPALGGAGLTDATNR